MPQEVPAKLSGDGERGTHAAVAVQNGGGQHVVGLVGGEAGEAGLAAGVVDGVLAGQAARLAVQLVVILGRCVIANRSFVGNTCVRSHKDA